MADQHAAGGVPASQLASLFDCSEKTIRQLAIAGIVVKAGRGQYALGQSIQSYVKHLRAQAAGRLGRDETIDPSKESALFKREQAKHYALKNAILEGTVVPVDKLEPAWAIIVRAVRSAMLAAPGKIRMRLPHLSAHDGEVIDEVIRAGLTDAALSDEPPVARE